MSKEELSSNGSMQRIMPNNFQSRLCDRGNEQVMLLLKCLVAIREAVHCSVDYASVAFQYIVVDPLLVKAGVRRGGWLRCVVPMSYCHTVSVICVVRIVGGSAGSV
eukprot:2226-Amphidinium_carterae.1